MTEIADEFRRSILRKEFYMDVLNCEYSHFHCRCQSVLDHGRIVESPQYGKVFYVLFMDWEDMHIRYNDKFAR